MTFTPRALALVCSLTAAIALGCGETDTDEDRPERDDDGLGSDLGDDDSDMDGDTDDGTGDDDDGGTGGDDLELGPDDRYASDACESLDGGTDVVAASSASEAGQTVLSTGSNKVYNIIMPAEGPGFVTLEIADWMVSVRVFSDAEASYTIAGGDVMTDVQSNGACPDSGITDQTIEFHDWGSYTVEIAEDSPDEVFFLAVVED